jgi:hypothetical protein
MTASARNGRRFLFGATPPHRWRKGMNRMIKEDELKLLLFELDDARERLVKRLSKQDREHLLDVLTTVAEHVYGDLQAVKESKGL